MDDLSTLKETIRAYVMEQFLEAEEEPVKDDTPLISGGCVDSFSMVSLKRFLEHRYNLAIPNEMATAEAFDSVDKIAALVHGLLKP